MDWQIKPNLIVSDVMMPGASGIEFCKRTPNDFETRHVPFEMPIWRDTWKRRLKA